MHHVSGSRECDQRACTRLDFYAGGRIIKQFMTNSWHSCMSACDQVNCAKWSFSCYSGRIPKSQICPESILQRVWGSHSRTEELGLGDFRCRLHSNLPNRRNMRPMEVRIDVPRKGWMQGDGNCQDFATASPKGPRGLRTLEWVENGQCLLENNQPPKCGVQGRTHGVGRELECFEWCIHKKELNDQVKGCQYNTRTHKCAYIVSEVTHGSGRQDDFRCLIMQRPVRGTSDESWEEIKPLYHGGFLGTHRRMGDLGDVTDKIAITRGRVSEKNGYYIALRLPTTAH